MGCDDTYPLSTDDRLRLNAQMHARKARQAESPVPATIKVEDLQEHLDRWIGIHYRDRLAGGPWSYIQTLNTKIDVLQSLRVRFVGARLDLTTIPERLPTG